MVEMKILRLSLFNLKKNKKEALTILFLTLITSLMLSIFVTNGSKIEDVFADSFEASGSVNEIILFRADRYHDEYRKILEDDYKPENLVSEKIITALFNDFIEPDGEKISYNALFVTEKTERKIEDFVKKEHISDEEIAEVSHPIWLPESFFISRNYKLGDTWTLVKSGKEYPFTVVGFYETGLIASDGYGFKCIVSDEDYALLTLLFTEGLSSEQIILCFDANEDFSFNEYIEKCEEYSSDDILAYTTEYSYTKERDAEIMFVQIYLLILLFMSVITMISALIMIRHKISNDIEDQMQMIGVLEALGYKSFEISRAYLYEYVLAGGLGSILGGIIAVVTNPFINRGVAASIGREVHGGVDIGSIVFMVILITIVVTLFALLKARTIKNYPPIIAFRKGIKTHHFGRNVMPLSKTKRSINVRLAMKSLLTDLKSCIGISLCIIASGTAILFSAFCSYTFKDGAVGLWPMLGCDDVEMVSLMSGVDVYAIRDEIEAMPEVDRAMVTFEKDMLSVKNGGESGSTTTYEDYSYAKYFAPSQGRFPEHDNEVMISVKRAERENLAIGDSMVLTYKGVEKNYIVTGILSAMTNSGNDFYITKEGYERVNLNARPDVVYVFLKDGVDPEAFEEKLSKMYGGTAKDAIGVNGEAGSLEERIKAVADEKIATLLSQYGVTSIDYAVRIGDEVITGNNRNYVIREITNWRGMLKSQVEPIAESTKAFTTVALIVTGIIVAVILGIIASTNVRRQRQRLGIMKGLGYSSKDLMTQMALRIMPVTVVSVILASILAIVVNKAFWLSLFGTLADTNYGVIVVTDIFMILLCYFATYLGAGKIKKISVNELMTE